MDDASAVLIETLNEMLRAADESAAPRKVACIGSRDLLPDEVAFTERIGEALARRGLFVGSGNARGADQGYARGANRVDPGKVVLYLPEAGFNSDAIVAGNHVRTSPWPARFEDVAKTAHPNWPALNAFGRAAHTRNAAILEKATLCIAWPNRKGGGGTITGIRIAHMSATPVLDLRIAAHRDQLAKALEIAPFVAAQAPAERPATRKRK